jgi:hypothetical protein
MVNNTFFLVAFVLASTAASHAENFALKKAYQLHERFNNDIAAYVKILENVKADIERLKLDSERIKLMDRKEALAFFQCAFVTHVPPKRSNALFALLKKGTEGKVRKVRNSLRKLMRVSIPIWRKLRPLSQSWRRTRVLFVC